MTPVDTTLLIRYGPVLGSTLAVMHSFDQYIFGQVFLQKPVEEHHKEDESDDKLLSTMFTTLYFRSINVVSAINTLTISTALGSLLRNDGVENASTRQWFAIGLGLTITHFMFVPVVAYPLRAIARRQTNKAETTSDDLSVEITRWLNVHLVRTVLVDMPAWACYVSGAIALITEK